MYDDRLIRWLIEGANWRLQLTTVACAYPSQCLWPHCVRCKAQNLQVNELFVCWMFLFLIYRISTAKECITFCKSASRMRHWHQTRLHYWLLHNDCRHGAGLLLLLTHKLSSSILHQGSEQTATIEGWPSPVPGCVDPGFCRTSAPPYVALLRIPRSMRWRRGQQQTRSRSVLLLWSLQVQGKCDVNVMADVADFGVM